MLNKRIEKKKCELKRVRSRTTYLEKTNAKAKEHNEILEKELVAAKEIVTTAVQENNESNRKANEERQENDWLRSIINDTDNTNVNVYDSETNRYSTELHMCVYSLLEQHVSAQHVSAVISSVLSLVGKSANQLPCASTVHNMNIQRLVISQKQLADVVPNLPDTCLYTDETSKYGNKVGGYHVRDKDGTYFTLGLRDLTTKSGKDTLETFKEILEDIDTAAGGASNENSKQILTNIRSTMSDSASTEIKFNNLLEEYRSTLLPYTVENYNDLDDESKQSLNALGNFFCGLHSLVHFAEASAKSVLTVENEIFNDKPPIHDPSFKKPSESGTTRLIRTACKSFARGADEKSGCHLQFVTHIAKFMKEKCIRTLKLVPNRGHMFNILFHNAGQVYMLHTEMIQFLQGYSLNRLTQSVLHDLEIPVYIAGCKALGLISKLISTPLWNILEDRTIHILDMNKYYLMLANGLKDAALDISQFMKGQNKPFGEISIKEDCVYKCLVEESQYDNTCETILSVVLPAISQYVNRKFVDFLPGGKFEQSTESEMETYKSVEKHNIFSERVFAYYDNLLKFKPHISTLASEAYITFTLNKTKEWLDTKCDKEADRIVKDARHGVAELRQRFKRRNDIIIAKRQERLKEQRKANEAAAARKLKEQEKMTDDITYYGLWQSEQQIGEHLDTYQSQASKVIALKAQLRFRKDVLKQRTGDIKVYNFTHMIDGKRVNLTVTELSTNLKTLVQRAFLEDSDTVKPQETQILLGNRVKHKFTQNGADTWYYGKVISQVPGYPSWYNITYDDDSAVYSYQLLKDYQNECLAVCV